MKKIIINITILISIFCSASAQTKVNREWETSTGNPLALDWTNSIISSNDQLISIGNTVVTGQGANILTTKYNTDGTINWQSTFQTTGINNDYGVALAEDNFGNIIVVGTTDNGGTINHDVVILKYDLNGGLIWSHTYNSAFNKNDIGTAIKIDGSGNIYICGASEGNSTSFDYLLIKYNSSGILQWTNRYDFASLIEIPIGVDIDVVGNVFVTGASASSLTNWDFTIAKFTSSGTYINDVRNSAPGIGFDQPLSYKKDLAGNIYITGKSSIDGINYDIKTIKLNSSFVIQWTSVIDFASKEDVGNSLDIDGLGNVYIGGYITKINNINDGIVVKFDANGIEQWRKEFYSIDANGDAFIKAIDVTNSGDIYYVGQEKGLNGSKDLLLSKLETNGKLYWARKLNNAIDEKPTNVNVATDGSIYVSALKDGTLDSYETIKYSEFKVNDDIIYDANGKPICKANDLIVRFEQNALDVNAIDNIGNKEIEFAEIGYYLTPTSLIAFNDALASICNPTNSKYSNADNPCGIIARKVFTEFKTTETTAISRLGHAVKIPDFWTTILLEFPSGTDIEVVNIALKTIPNIVRYSEPNFIGELSASCNDPEYATNQHSLHPIAGSGFTNADINVEEAWDVATDGGTDKVRCGVFDSGIEWKLPDFGYDGTNAITSKVIDVWLFDGGFSLKQQNFSGDLNGHGTACAGIIGAIRNNNIGIAGIAGGDASLPTPNTGVALYGLSLFDGFGNIISNIFPQTQLNDALNAIASTSKLDPTKNFEYGLHVTNHSYGFQQNSGFWGIQNNTLLKEAVHFANRMQVTQVASRGNYTNTAQTVNGETYPATIDDDWILNVGGTGEDGCYIEDGINGNFTAMREKNVDIGAPANDNMIQSLAFLGGYQSFSGTSASAPHVVGAVSLLMSYWNSPTDVYQNLAPEDCEKIIELTARTNGDCIAVPNDRIGAGLLDVGKALKLIEKPNKGIKHYGTLNLTAPNIIVTQVGTNIVMALQENYQNEAGVLFYQGGYKVNKYKVEASVNHVIGSNDNIVAYWPRPSMSNVLEDLDINSILLARERLKINSCTNTTCNMTGYVYEVFDATTNAPLGWWPFDVNSNPSQAILEYTILTAPIVVGPNQISNSTSSTNNIKVFPNPATAVNTIEFSTNIGDKIEISIIDLIGKKIKSVINTKSNSMQFSIKSNIEDLQNGIYYYEIKIADKISLIKFVKI
jgi:Subtilase family/Secretion system C-terminal sorting domain